MGGPAETARLDSLNHRSYRLAEAGHVAAAEDSLVQALALYGQRFPGFGERPAVEADTIAAGLFARLAFARFERGDTTGAADAYERGMGHFYLLPDSLRSDRLRRVAYVAGLVDYPAGYAMLERLRDEAADRGDTTNWRHALRCLAELGEQSPETLPSGGEEQDISRGVPVAVLFAIAACLFVWGFAEHQEKRRYRTELFSRQKT